MEELRGLLVGTRWNHLPGTRGSIPAHSIMNIVDASDIEEELEGPAKKKRETCYEKSCTRKPSIEMTFTVGQSSWTEMFCERCAKELEVFGWKRQ